MNRILVIKLGALGDFVQAFGAFATIRASFPEASITLLTTAPFVELASASPWFDEVLTDTRPGLRHPLALWRLSRRLRGYDRVFDLQTSGRSGQYFRLSRNRQWCGAVKGCSHPHANPARDDMHTLPRIDDQLRMAGLTPLPRTIPDWLTQGGPKISGRYGVLVPGAAPHRPRKRWPASRFADVANAMIAQGLTPVITGSRDDTDLGHLIQNLCPRAVDLTSKTDLIALAGVLHRADIVIGNDTGPLHLASAMDTACVTLFSDDSDPRLSAPLTITPEKTRAIVVSDLAVLPASRVVRYLPA